MFVYNFTTFDYIKKVKVMRNCDGCTRCCEGWLEGEAHGKTFFPGKPCHFVKLGVGCADYKNRPSNPCKAFICEWILNKDIPEWMKPNLSNVIIKRDFIEGIPYYNIVECGEKIDSSVLNWIILNFAIKNHNILYTVDGGKNYLGTSEFIDAMIKVMKKEV